MGQVALRDDAVRITGLVSESLKPLRLVDGVGGAKRRLDMDRLRHIREADLGDIVVDPIVLRLQCVDIAEKSVNGLAFEPRIPQLRALQVVQVKVGVDEGNFGHCGIPSREAVTIAALVEMLPPLANAKQATGSAARRRSEELSSNSIAEGAGRRNNGRSVRRVIAPAPSFSAKRGRWPEGPDGVRKAGMARCKFALSVLQSDLRRGSGPPHLARPATFPSRAGKGSRLDCDIWQGWTSPRVFVSPRASSAGSA